MRRRADYAYDQMELGELWAQAARQIDLAQSAAERRDGRSVVLAHLTLITNLLHEIRGRGIQLLLFEDTPYAVTRPVRGAYETTEDDWPF